MPVISRRTLLFQLGIIGAAAGGAVLLRERVIFAPPTITFEGAGGAPAWTRLDGPGGLIRLTGAIGAEPVSVVIDSGAQYSAIDGALAERLALHKGLPLPMLAYGVSGRPSVVRTVGLDLDLAQIRVRGLRAASLDLASLSAAAGQPFALLLGRDVLRSAVLDADFPGRRMAFRPGAAYAPPPGAVAAPARRRDGALMAQVQVESAPAVEALVDTGMTGALALSEAAAEAAGLLGAGRAVGRAHSLGLGGLSVDRVVWARRVGFAGFTFEDVPVQIYRPAPGGAIPSALLGVGLLDRFRVTLDHGRGQIHLAAPVRPADAGRRAT